MDEPANPPDLACIGPLRRWIHGLLRDMGLVIASHARALLDDIATRTLFLRDRQSPAFALPRHPHARGTRGRVHRKKGAAALLFSHDRSLIREVGTRFWWIETTGKGGGKLVEADSPEPFIARLTSGD